MTPALSRLSPILLVAILALAGCSKPAPDAPADEAAAVEAAGGATIIPERTAAAMDLTGRLPKEATERLSKRLADFKTAEGADIGILVVETTGMVPMADYARQVAVAWKLGRPNVADGVLIAYAIGDGSIQIEVGCGLETTVDSNTLANLISEEILPSFERKDYAGGLGVAVDALTTLIAHAPIPDAKAPMPEAPIWAGEPVSPGCQV